MVSFNSYSFPCSLFNVIFYFTPFFRLETDFVSYRGLLTKLCCAPYEKRDGWIICAAKFRGTIYLCTFDTDAQKYRNAHMTKRDLQCSSWGFKFEQYLLSGKKLMRHMIYFSNLSEFVNVNLYFLYIKDSPNSQPDTLEPVNESEEFCCLFSTKLGTNSLLYGAEMDGVCSKNMLEAPVDWKTIKFIELKTNRTIETDNQYRNYQKKLLKWWCQSFIVGIENVMCGMRTDSGLVFELNNIKVSDMPKTCKVNTLIFPNAYS